MHKDTNKYLAQELLDVQQTLGWMDLVLSSINDAVCVTNSDGKIIFANDYFACLTDITRVFLLGQDMKEVIDLKRIEVPLAEYRDRQSVLAGISEDGSGIYEWKNKKGQILKFRVASRLLPNSDQCVYLIQNITSEYELTKIKDNFINLASHQLRTPMTAIMLYANMLGSGIAGPLSGKQQVIAKTIIQSTERMNQLVNGLLKITRAQSDKAVMLSESISITNIFGQILTELRPGIMKKKLKCSVNIPESIPDIMNDSSAVHEIFSNLVVNAVQYTRESGSITITSKKVKNTIVTKVADTGIGIPKAQQHLLFSQFSRADNALEEFAEGTGLGLYLIKILLEKIGGKIEFQSEINIGTTFTVTLPINTRTAA